jgi:hypothetical protein
MRILKVKKYKMDQSKFQKSIDLCEFWIAQKPTNYLMF